MNARRRRGGRFVRRELLQRPYYDGGDNYYDEYYDASDAPTEVFDRAGRRDNAAVRAVRGGCPGWCAERSWSSRSSWAAPSI